MRAFNARKTCKEHYLFKNKFGKISLINKDGETGVFRVRKLKRDNYKIFGGCFTINYCFDQINAILVGTKNGISIGQFIKFIEKGYRTKIEDLGLTREDFARLNTEKISKALMKNYKQIKE